MSLAPVVLTKIVQTCRSQLTDVSVAICSAVGSCQVGRCVMQCVGLGQSSAAWLAPAGAMQIARPAPGRTQCKLAKETKCALGRPMLGKLALIVVEKVKSGETFGAQPVPALSASATSLQTCRAVMSRGAATGQWGHGQAAAANVAMGCRLAKPSAPKKFA